MSILIQILRKPIRIIILDKLALLDSHFSQTNHPFNLRHHYAISPGDLNEIVNTWN